MRIRKGLLKYFLITNFIWGMYLVWLIPFQLIIVGLDWNQFVKWITIGTLCEFFVAYVIAKLIVRYVPKIEKFVDDIK